MGTPVVIADTSVLPSEIRGYCIEAKEGELGISLSKLIKGYGAYEDRYSRIKGEVTENFSGESAETVYKGIMDTLNGVKPDEGKPKPL